MSGAPATSSENTLNKASAHLRWLIEKSGVNPERAIVCVILDTVADRDKLEARFADEFRPATMSKSSASPHQIVANGVKITVTVREMA